MAFDSTCQIFTQAEIASLRIGGAILRDCLQYVSTLVKPGITTLELDIAAEDFIQSKGGRPAFKGYFGFTGTLCTSINEECVHGIPGKRVLVDGDIVSLDCGVRYGDLNTDACVTIPVGSISEEAQKLLQVTELALMKALSMLKAGVRVGDVSSTIQKTVESGGFHVIHALTGHGLGKNLHEFPDIPNYGRAGTGPVFPAGSVIAIEPIVSVGTERVMDQPDGWTIVTYDQSLSAHVEHTILVTESGCEIIA